MKLQTLDFAVIVLYLIIVSSVGIILRNKASNSKNEYMLGGKTLPFWMLGISNASGMFDISGTIWMVSIMFVYGLKSIWLVWLWPVFNQVFLFSYLAVWLRRSNASTGAEWMITRFGKGKDAMRSHKIIIAFALLSCFGFMAYGFIGLGKFIEIFIPLLIVVILSVLILLYYIKKKKYTHAPLTNVTVIMSPIVLRENPLYNIEELKL
jgi:Na+/pantothenate symporter